MIALLTFFSVLVISLVVTKVATVALMQTGLSRDTARFQARSAFSGAGFTTQESEAVVNHATRRRIVMLLILAGNAGLVTAISSLILSFTGGGAGAPNWVQALVLAAGLAVFYFFATSTRIDRLLSHLILKWMTRRGNVRFLDYARLLETEDGFGVVEFRASAHSWLKGETLGELRLKDEGVLVLGIHRDDHFIGTPGPDCVIEENDRLTFYGDEDVLAALEQREAGRSGDEEHDEAADKEAERKESDRETVGKEV